MLWHNIWYVKNSLSEYLVHNFDFSSKNDIKSNFRIFKKILTTQYIGVDSAKRMLYFLRTISKKGGSK